MLTPSQPFPVRFEFLIVTDDSYLREFALRLEWSAFEAACLIMGLQPIGIIEGDLARVGVLETSLFDNEYLDAFDRDHDRHEAYARNLRMLGKAVSLNWPGGTVDAKTLVEWALSKGEMRPDTFTDRVLGTSLVRIESDLVRSLREELELRDTQAQEDLRGSHHAEKRLGILGVAIRELAESARDTGKIDRLFHGESVNAAGLATHLDRFRSDVGLPDENIRGFGPRQIEDVLRDALKAAEKLSTHKS